jgi:hypothetical protein
MPSPGRKVRTAEIEEVLVRLQSASIPQIVSRWNSIANRVHALKSFILGGAFFALHHFCGSTIALPTENNPPRPPRFAIPNRGTCSDGVSSFLLFGLANS